MKKLYALLVILFFILIGCTTPEETLEDEDTAEHIVLAEHLSIPWSIEKTEEVYYLTEREGAIVKIEDGEVDRQIVELDEPISQESEAGLLGFVLDPDFQENQQAFAYYTYEGNDGPINRIIRLELAENTWSEIDVLLDDIPGGPIHHGGRLAIGPDEKLYATTGDAAEPQLAQNFDGLAGKVLRFNLDGTIPEDNLFENSYVYTYGHRNPQGLTWLDNGMMYASEHGNQANDEINLLETGENYGWPEIEGTEEREGMEAPVYTSGADETWAPSGMDQYQEKLYIAALRGNGVLEIDVQTDEIRKLFTEYGRIRDVYIEEDTLYFITNNTDGRGDPVDTDDRLIQVDLPEIE